MSPVICAPVLRVVTFTGAGWAASMAWAPIPVGTAAVPGSSGNRMDGQITPTNPIPVSAGASAACALMIGNMPLYRAFAPATSLFQPWLKTNRFVTPEPAISETRASARAAREAAVLVELGNPVRAAGDLIHLENLLLVADIERAGVRTAVSCWRACAWRPPGRAPGRTVRDPDRSRCCRAAP